MKTIGIKEIRTNPGLVTQASEAQELVLVTNRGKPVSIVVPLTERILEHGLPVALAHHLLRENIVGLRQASKIAGLQIEAFLNTLKGTGIVVVDQSEDDVIDDLKTLQSIQGTPRVVDRS
ncbi:type II toxin-antitoxin system Phd/YefM family antitoxin [Ketobacter sp. MCCC 1A13808]|uniref:UPF0175 family protein n=1 Tax=Ketobacter sp. MCCC 1A13808 TaxID=2602738 RepID=UPI0012EB405A|nr:UPF0175 family protein [Ketobacter sp. MCCC 1A13808]MVF14807.1 type II toxin-antitoxin system Phd/YefM family antitoxin [Ketobacter sp. MCCC 1A13808]